jgi:hypothetical protein
MSSTPISLWETSFRSRCALATRCSRTVRDTVHIQKAASFAR